MKSKLIKVSFLLSSKSTILPLLCYVSPDYNIIYPTETFCT